MWLFLVFWQEYHQKKNSYNTLILKELSVFCCLLAFLRVIRLVSELSLFYWRNIKRYLFIIRVFRYSVVAFYKLTWQTLFVRLLCKGNVSFWNCAHFMWLFFFCSLFRLWLSFSPSIAPSFNILCNYLKHSIWVWKWVWNRLHILISVKFPALIILKFVLLVTSSVPLCHFLIEGTTIGSDLTLKKKTWNRKIISK